MDFIHFPRKNKASPLEFTKSLFYQKKKWTSPKTIFLKKAYFLKKGSPGNYLVPLKTTVVQSRLLHGGYLILIRFRTKTPYIKPRRWQKRS